MPAQAALALAELLQKSISANLQQHAQPAAAATGHA
jgi:hypothetical protein